VKTRPEAITWAVLRLEEAGIAIPPAVVALRRGGAGTGRAGAR
jgi:hypothetical protein